MIKNKEYAAYVKRMVDTNQTPLPFQRWIEAEKIVNVAAEEVRKYYAPK